MGARSPLLKSGGAMAPLAPMVPTPMHITLLVLGLTVEGECNDRNQYAPFSGAII